MRIRLVMMLSLPVQLQCAQIECQYFKSIPLTTKVSLFPKVSDVAPIFPEQRNHVQRDIAGM